MIHPAAAIIASLLIAGPAAAQAYRCGNTYQQTPCRGSPVVVKPRHTPVELVSEADRLADAPACHGAIRERLVDPESARFKPDPPHTLAQGTRNYGYLVNARNRMGGYAGADRWICRVSPKTGVVVGLLR